MRCAFTECFLPSRTLSLGAFCALWSRLWKVLFERKKTILDVFSVFFRRDDVGKKKECRERESCFQNLVIYRTSILSLVCALTALSSSSWSMLSNNPTISSSRTHSYFLHLSLVTLIAPNADLFGLFQVKNDVGFVL